jgi:hypothetical protein
MRILILLSILVLFPAALSAQQGGRRGAPVPARAVREAAAARPTVPKEVGSRTASPRAPGRFAEPPRPEKRPRGS